jgi:hypothetical protein
VDLEHHAAEVAQQDLANATQVAQAAAHAATALGARALANQRVEVGAGGQGRDPAV